MFGSIVAKRSTSAWRMRSESPRTRNHQRRSGRLGRGWDVDTSAAYPEAAQPKAGHIAHDRPTTTRVVRGKRWIVRLDLAVRTRLEAQHPTHGFVTRP